MKINLIEVKKPFFTEFQLCSKPDIEFLKKSKIIRISPSLHTKTRIHTSMQIGNSRNGINIPIEGFKTHEESHYSYFSGEIQACNYFVKSKKQGIEAYKEYVKKLVEIVLKDYINIEIDEITIELEIVDFLK